MPSRRFLVQTIETMANHGALMEGQRWINEDAEAPSLEEETSIEDDIQTQKTIVVYVSWRFPQMGVPQNEWFIKKKSLKLDDFGVPPL